MPDDIPVLDPAIRADIVAAAGVATDRILAEFPELVARYGDRGRVYADHDHAYLLSWAVDAAALGAPELFARNAAWLYSVLDARDFPMDVYRRTLAVVGEVAAERGLLSAGQTDRIIGGALSALPAAS